MKSNFVIYHKSDFDGLFCREIAKQALGDNAEYIGWEYGEPTPEVPLNVNLYILDLSVPDLMNHPLLIWIDHHKSAIEKYDKDDGTKRMGLRIDGVAACRLAWQWFFVCLTNPPTKEMFVETRVREPLAVRLAGEYDVWDKRDYKVDLFQYGLRSVVLTENEWDELLSYSTVGGLVADLIKRGQVCQDYQRLIDADILKSRAFDLYWGGLTFLAINHARCNSLTFESGAKEYHDGLLSFCWNGKKWTISMYHTPFNREIDLSAVAIKHGGGGHKGACGFTCDKLPFDILVANKD